MIRLLLPMLCFVITSCTMDCVEPGLQNRSTSVDIEVPVRKNDENLKIYWVDSGQVISKDEKVKFSVNGSIDFCPRKDAAEILVPAVFCSDGSEPDYSIAKDNDKLSDDFGLYANKVCGKSFGNSKRRYVDTKVKVNPGDKLTFSLISRKINIDCSKPALFEKKIILDDHCYKKDEHGNRTLDLTEICRKSFCQDKDDKENKNYEVLVGNGYTPYDNKVHFNASSINTAEWMIGSLLDLRRTKKGLNELCDGERKKGGNWKARCGLKEMGKYGSYELNCYNHNICYNKSGMIDKNCISSIRYKKYHGTDNQCDMYSHLKDIENNFQSIKDKSIALNADDIENISWADALVAKISPSTDYKYTPYTDRFDMRDDAKGTQCFPKKAKDSQICSEVSDNFEVSSLKLDYEYEVSNDVENNSSVMLAIASNGNYHLHRGGYHVKVSKSCNFANGKKLYIYLGDKPLEEISGTNDFREVETLEKETKTEDKDKVVYYIIDGGHLNKDESKKIHFGIDVSNVRKEDITDKDGKYYKNNKYNVNLFTKRKINDFISSTINKIFSYIKGESTDSAADSVKESYEGYRRGFLQIVRNLLTLYIIFSVIGYMLGTVQLSKFDFIVRITKIAFITFVFSDKSWELFGKNLSMLFIEGSAYLVDSFSGYIGEGNEKFAFLDLTVGVLFSWETWLKFLSLMLSGPFGFIAFLIILYATFKFLECMISAIVKYVIAIVLGGFLLSLTPLFIVFFLFQQTKPLFDGWIKTLAHISLQPVILFSSLSLLNQLMYSVLYNLTNFSACYQCLISVNLWEYDLCIIKSILPIGYSPGTSVDTALSNGERIGGHFAALPIDLIQAFIYLIIASAMEAFVLMSENIAQAIFQTGYGIVGSVGQVARSASQAALSTVGLDDQTQQKIEHIKRGLPQKKPTMHEFKAKSLLQKNQEDSKLDIRKNQECPSEIVSHFDNQESSSTASKPEKKD